MDYAVIPPSEKPSTTNLKKLRACESASSWAKAKANGTKARYSVAKTIESGLYWKSFGYH